MSILTCIIIAFIQSCIAVVLICVFQWIADKRFQAIVAKRNEQEYAEAAEEAAAKDKAAEQEEAVEEEQAAIAYQQYCQRQCDQILENERRANEHAAWVVDQKARAAWPELSVGKDTDAKFAELMAWTKARRDNPNHPY